MELHVPADKRQGCYHHLASHSAINTQVTAVNVNSHSLKIKQSESKEFDTSGPVSRFGTLITLLSLWALRFSADFFFFVVVVMSPIREHWLRFSHLILCRAIT